MVIHLLEVKAPVPRMVEMLLAFVIVDGAAVGRT